MIDADDVFRILDEEHQKCLTSIQELSGGNGNLYALAQNIALLQSLRKRIEELI